MRLVPEDVRIDDWMASGLVFLTGHGTGPPLIPPGRAASTARRLGEHLAEATAGRVRVDGRALLGERAAFTGGVRRGRISVGGAARLLRTVDGWAAVSYARPDDRQLYGALLGHEIEGDPWPHLASWAAGHRGDDLADGAVLLGLPAAPVRPAEPAAPPRCPGREVVGLRVVDLSALWAGPLCGHLLTLGGADVIKVETPTRPDGARRGHAGFYRLLHSGQRAVIVDPETPEGRADLVRLVRSADVVIEASRPRALRHFGLDAEAEVARGATWISITAAGRAVDRVGFGDDIAAAAGLVAQDADGSPVFVGDAIADPLVGLTAAVCAASVVSGDGGALWDLAMAGLVADTLDGSPTVVAPGEPPRPRHRRPGRSAPAHGADPLPGPDR